MTTITRSYVTADQKPVALQVTDGESFWLADLTGDRISEFCVNAAQVTIQARRRFGRLSWTESVGYIAWGQGMNYPRGLQGV